MGPEAVEALDQCRVIVVGLGGVGSWCAEALVRSGIGKISLVDSDKISASNINRQVEATSKTVDRLKTDALAERLNDINPACEIKSFPHIFSKETANLFDIPGSDYVIDAIDNLGCKLDLIETALSAGKRFFSSMGMARKLDPTLIKTADIWKTFGCPLARLVRQGLRKRKVSGHFTAVYSPEHLALPAAGDDGNDGNDGKRPQNGSAAPVTATAGMILASLVIRDIYNRYTLASGAGRRG